MFCKKCGKELDDTAKFCGACGQNQDESIKLEPNKNINNVILEGKDIVKGFFSKNPLSVIKSENYETSIIGIPLIIINILLFGFVSCLNITQYINKIINSVTSYIGNIAEDLLGDFLGGMTTTGITNFEIPTLFSLFIPLCCFAAVLTVILFFGIYIIFKTKKTNCKNFKVIYNAIGISYFPLDIALILNFIVGIFLPQYTLFIFLFGFILMLIMLYESCKIIFETDKKPIFEFSILLILIIVFLAIGSQIAINSLINSLQKILISSASDGAKDIISSFF